MAILYGMGLCLLLHSHSFNDPVDYPQTLALSILALLASVLAWRRSEPIPGPLWPVALPALLFGWSLLSTLWAQSPTEALWSASKWGFLAVWVGLLQQWMAREVLSPVRIARGLALLAAVLAIVGLLQRLGVDPLALSDEHRSPNSILANRNFFGTAMMMALPFSLYLLLQDRGTWKAIGILATLLQLAGIIVAVTRGAILPLGLGLLIFPPIAIFWTTRGKTRILAWGIWLLVIAGAFFGSKFILKTKEAKLRWEYLTESGHRVQPTSSSMDFRFISWHHSLSLAAERPLTGHGAGHSKMEAQRYGLQSYDPQGRYGMVVPLHPHNEWLSALAELGIPGWAILSALFGLGWWSAIRRVWRAGNWAERLWGLVLCWAWLAISIDAVFSFPLQRPFHLMLCALLLAATPLTLTPGKPLPRGRNLLAIPFLLMAILLCLGRMQVDPRIRKIREAHARSESATVLRLGPEATNGATNLDPVAALSVEWYIGMAHAQLGQIDQALQAMQKAREACPHSLAIRSSMASILDLNHRYQEAADSMSSLLTVFPDYEEGWVNLAIMQFHANKPALARASISKVKSAAFADRVAMVDAALKNIGY